MGKIYKKTKITLIAIMTAVSGGLSAQVDVSTGGPVTTYSNVSDAFTAINAGTHTGMISINITSNTTEPSTPTALVANGVGTATYTSIRLQPTVTATISGSPVSGRSVIEINGADSVIINGDISGGAIGRDLSITNTNLSSVTLTSVIRLIGTTTAPGLGCRANQIKNCIITGNVDPTSTSPVTSIAGILAGGGTGATITSLTTVGNNFDNLLIENNQIKKSYYAVIVAGNTAATSCSDSLIISKNLIGSTVATEYNIFRGVYLANCLGAKIYDNSIFNQFALNSTSIAGLEVVGNAAVSSNDSIVRNYIYGIHMPSTSGWGAYGINLTTGSNHSIVNNVIYDITTTNYSSTSTTYNAFGIRLTSGTGHRIYYNSVNMYGNYSSTANTSAASSAFVVTSTAITGLDVKNNIFNNKTSSVAATKRFYAVWFPSSYNFTTTNLDNNAYMVSGVASSHFVGAIGTTTQSTITNWRTVSQVGNATNDVNSIPPANGNAPFIADNNLLITNNMPTLIESGATIISGLGLPNTDILLNSRPKSGVNPNANPDMGAYEFDGIQDYFDVGVSAILKPVTSASKCFNGTDTIVLRIKNNYTNTYDISAKNIPVHVMILGPNPATYSLTLTTGTLTGGATLDTLITVNYDMSYTGTYTFKGYTNVFGDGSISNDTTILSITKKPVFTISALANDSVCKGQPVQLSANTNTAITIGSGTIVNSSTSYPAPYGHFYEGAKHQFLFLASELNAAGLVAGNINSMAFNATNLNGSDPLINYNIAIATTTLTSITSMQTVGFSTYFSAASYTPVLGANTHAFSTPYVWDGISNIIIETCFNNTPTGYSNNVSITQSSTPFTSTVWYRADGVPALCTSTSLTGSMAQRPNISFGQPQTLTYVWSPAAGLSSTSVSNPSITALNNSAAYTVTVTNIGSGCASRSTINLFMKPTPEPILGNDTLYCTLPAILNANTTADSYLWNNSATTSTINITNAGKYWVMATNTNGCTNTDTINTTLGNLPIVTLGQDTAFCQGKSITLYAGNPGSTYLWNTGATTSTIAVNTVGTYSVVVTNSTSCKSSDVVNVTAKSNPTVSLVFTGQTIFCPTVSGRILNEGAPSGGNYIGAGVSGTSPNQMFNANQAGQGTYVILYNYTAPNGCNNIAKDTLFVQACVGVDELTNDVSLNVYPNPNTGLFTMEINANSDIDAKIHIMSIDSRLVYEDVITGNGLITKTIDISPLANGIYYLRLETKDVVKTFKLMKQ